MSDVFPDRSMEHREKIDWMIETQGWALVPVPAAPELDPPVPAYAYTIGLEDAFGFPEVVVVGLTPVAARGLIGLVVELLGGGTEIPIGDVFVGLLDNDLRSALVPVGPAHHAALFPSAVEWHGGAPIRVVQLVWPDRQGWLPWESGFEERLRFAQPVLGAPPAS